MNHAWPQSGSQATDDLMLQGISFKTGQNTIPAPTNCKKIVLPTDLLRKEGEVLHKTNLPKSHPGSLLAPLLWQLSHCHLLYKTHSLVIIRVNE